MSLFINYTTSVKPLSKVKNKRHILKGKDHSSQVWATDKSTNNTFLQNLSLKWHDISLEESEMSAIESFFFFF